MANSLFNLHPDKENVLDIKIIDAIGINLTLDFMYKHHHSLITGFKFLDYFIAHIILKVHDINATFFLIFL